MTKIIEKTAKIVVVRQDNPFREGSAVFKRARAVLTSKTVADALKKGARTSTVRYFVACKQVRLEAAAAKAASKQTQKAA